MDRSVLRVSMLGSFSFEWNGQRIDDSANRMRKIWLLLAYLIYNRNRNIDQSGFISLLHGEDAEELDNPANRIKALFYRARTMLGALDANLGHNLILSSKGSYAWNREIPLELDVEAFDRLCGEAAAAQDSQTRLSLYLQALELYKGNFLPKLSMEQWVMPISAYYQQLFLQAVETVLPMLEESGRWDEAEQICAQALRIEPYSEALYQHKMRCYLAKNDQRSALAAYEKMSEILFDMFGVIPSEESRLLFREASKTTNKEAVTIATVREQLREAENPKGALFCEFEFFRLLYQVQSRALIRSGDVVHIALISCQGEDGNTLSPRSLATAMDNLQAVMLANLRQGDVVTRYSNSQLCCMLPNANYENSCAVCQRILKAFCRQYPHSPAKLHYRVQPLEPAVGDR